MVVGFGPIKRIVTEIHFLFPPSTLVGRGVSPVFWCSFLGGLEGFRDSAAALFWWGFATDGLGLRRIHGGLCGTLLETNMETQKGPYKDYSPSKMGPFWVSMLVSGVCIV